MRSFTSSAMALVSVAASYIGSLTGVSALIRGLLLGITLKELALPLVLLSVIGFSYDLTGGYRLASAAGVVCGALGLICTGILRKKLRTK